MPALLLAIGIGLISGVLSGAFGIGGGIITTPAIRLLMHSSALIAVGTPLPVIVPSAVTGAATYLRRGQAHLRAGLMLGAAGAATSVLGALAASRVGGPVVLVGTAVLIAYASIDMILQVFRPPMPQASSVADAEAAVSDAVELSTLRHDVDPGDASDRVASCASLDFALARMLAIGVLAGFYSGFLGLGGGFVIVPMLTRWARFPLKCAIGTSLVTVAVLAVPGSITHALLGNIDWGVATGLAIGVVPGAAIGARVTLGSDDRGVRIAFAVMLLAVAVWLAVSELPGVLAR